MCFGWIHDTVEAVESWKLLELTGLIPCEIAYRALGTGIQTGYHGMVYIQGKTFREKRVPGSVFPVEERR